jgi:hypothetical protein
LNPVIAKYAPYNRPIVQALNGVDLTSERKGFLGIPLKLSSTNVGVRTNRYEYCVKEFRYEMAKKANMEIFPADMERTHIPLPYNQDHFLTKNKKLSLQELQGMHDLAREMVDFQDAETCAWFITLHQLRPSMDPENPHLFDPPIATCEICRELVPIKKWPMDWPIDK